MNETVNAAVAAVNETKAKATQARAAIVIENIKAELNGSAANEKVIVEQRIELAKVSGDVYSVESIYGGSVPAGVNQETVVKVIEKINKDRQSQIAARAENIVRQIANAQDAIRQAGERITKYRAELNKLQPEQVTATEVAGS